MSKKTKFDEMNKAIIEAFENEYGQGEIKPICGISAKNKEDQKELRKRIVEIYLLGYMSAVKSMQHALEVVEKEFDVGNIIANIVNAMESNE